MADLGSIGWEIGSLNFVSFHVSGTVRDGGGTVVSRKLFVMSTPGEAAGTSTSVLAIGNSLADGTYSFGVGVNNAEVVVVCLDNTAGTVENHMVLRTTPV